jgi:hypothetical protein
MKPRYRIDPARMADPATRQAIRDRVARDFPGVTLKDPRSDAALEAIMDELVLIGVAVRVPDSLDA